MEDRKIVELYHARDESAIAETNRKYGRYCHAIAYRILRNNRDSEECVSDTWLRAWDSMPPKKPDVVSVFLGRITRNLSLDRVKLLMASKRGGGHVEAALDELLECIPSEDFAEVLAYALDQRNRRTNEAEGKRHKDVADAFKEKAGKADEGERGRFMKQERILYALGNVSESFIIESMPAARTRHPVKWLAPICAAAVLLIVSGIAYQMVQTRRNIEMETAEAETEPAEIEITAQTEGDAGGMVTESSSGDERFVDVKELLAAAGSGQATATEELVQKIMQIPIGSYTAVYEGVGNDGREAFREELYASRGAVFLENEGLYYVSGHTDKQYLILVQDNEASLWKFVCFDAEGYPYRDVLTQIYDVHSADGFAELIVSAGNMDNTPEGIRIQQEIGTRSITDRHSLHELYRILGSMTCYGQDQWDRIQLGSQDADTSGDMENMHQEVRMTRYLTVVTPYNEIDSLKYTAVSGMFYEFGGIAYEPLSETDAQIMRDMLGMIAM